MKARDVCQRGNREGAREIGRPSIPELCFGDHRVYRGLAEGFRRSEPYRGVVELAKSVAFVHEDPVVVSPDQPCALP